MTKPLKVFHINMHHHWGGQPNRILTECRGLLALGHEPWIAGPKECVLVQRARERGIKTFDDLELLRGCRPGSGLRDYRALKRLFAEERFDVVHPHGSQDTWVSVMAARAVRARPALVRTRHNTFPVAGHILNRWLYRQFDAIVTIAPQVDEIVSGSTGFPRERIHAIYSAPDHEVFYPRAPNPELRKEFGIPEGAPVIGKTARLAPEKGHHLFIGAAARVVREFPEARFICVGKGRCLPEIEALAERLGIRENVILTGFRTDVAEIESLFDVFCLTPTSGESLGTSILEAFLLEKPAVATQVGGTGESVRTGETGILIPPGSEEEQINGIAMAVLELLRDPEKRIRYGKAGRKMALEEFSMEGLARKSVEVYRGVCGLREPGGAL